jgi:hypothetical protein
MVGISGTAEEGADSFCYEDDVDCGDEIAYKGHGGRDPNSGEQVSAEGRRGAHTDQRSFTVVGGKAPNVDYGCLNHRYQQP